MCMKTKDEATEPSSQAQSLALTHPSPGSLLSPPLSPKERAVDAFVLGVQESGEQTQNVCENKGQGQEVRELRS
jgi:hypothetical protein